jgi:hypothetical protein
MTAHDHSPTPPPATRLLALLHAQQERLGQLDALSQRQGSLIQSDDHEGLLALVGERQRLVDACTVTAREVETLLTPARESGTPHECAEIDRRLDAVARLASGVNARDLADRVELERRRDALARELAAATLRETAAQAYTPPTPPVTPRYQDRRA